MSEADKETHVDPKVDETTTTAAAAAAGDAATADASAQDDAAYAKFFEAMKFKWEAKATKYDKDFVALETATAPYCKVKAVRIGLPIRASIENFISVVSNLDQLKSYDVQLKEAKTQEASDNSGQVLYTAYEKPGIGVDARDWVITSATRFLTGDEAKDNNIYEKAQIAEGQPRVWLSASLDASTKVPEQKGFVRGVLHLYGYAVVEVPNTDLIYVINIAAADAGGSIPTALVDAGMVESAGKLLKLRQVVEAEAQKDVPETAQKTGNLPAQNIERFLDACRYGWTGQKTKYDAQFVSFSTAPVKYCKSKAIRIGLPMRSTIEDFIATVSDLDQLKVYDPTLKEYKLLDDPTPDAELESSLMYTAYEKPGFGVAARDWVFRSKRKFISEEEAKSSGIYQAAQVREGRVWVQSSQHFADHPEQSGYTRGDLLLFGYAVVDVKEAGLIYVINVACADPKGSIPTTLVDAGMMSSVEKVLKLRELCEARTAKAKEEKK